MQLVGYVEFFTTTWIFYRGIYTALYIDHFLAKISKKTQTNKREQDRSAEMSFKHLSHWITG